MCQALTLADENSSMQLERLEQLTSRMEMLNAGFVTTATPPTASGTSDAPARLHSPSEREAGGIDTETPFLQPLVLVT